MTEGIEITRVFDAPRELVFKAWTEPERFAVWYGGPEGEIPMETCSMDVRPGGEWRALMIFGPERREIPFSGVYREVVEPERLVFTVTDQDPAEFNDLVTVILTDLGDGKTEMFFSQTGGGLTEQGYEAAKKGWGGFFDTMAEHEAKT
jgi:uncharacterized protein YndB with AHSA1/START domain